MSLIVLFASSTYHGGMRFNDVVHMISMFEEMDVVSSFIDFEVDSDYSGVWF
jgi:hypothetical protein